MGVWWECRCLLCYMCVCIYSIGNLRVCDSRPSYRTISVCLVILWWSLNTSFSPVITWFFCPLFLILRYQRFSRVFPQIYSFCKIFGALTPCAESLLIRLNKKPLKLLQKNDQWVMLSSFLLKSVRLSSSQKIVKKIVKKTTKNCQKLPRIWHSEISKPVLISEYLEIIYCNII